MLVRCSCGWEKNVKDELIGKKAECPKCKNSFVLKPVQPLAVVEPEVIVPVRVTPRVETTPPVAVQVNVPPDSPAGNSLGIGSIVVGILGLMVCWIPLLGLLGVPLSALGLLCGVIGIIIALTRHGRGIGFPIAGSAVSGLALVICFVVNFMLLGEPVRQAREAARRAAEQQNAARPAAPVAIQPAREKVAKPAPAPVDPKQIAAGSFEDEMVIVSFEKARIGKVEIQSIGRTSESEEPQLIVTLRIKNKSDSRKLDYSTWGASDFDRFAASLEDDLGNNYKRIHFGFSSRPIGQQTSESVYPEKDLTDLLIFEVPVGKAHSLILKLPKRAFGGSGDAYIRFDAAQIER